MASYHATVLWQRQDDDVFINCKYSRAHQWVFDGGTTIAASSSPHIVPLPYSVEENVDPEEAFIASLSSCHMLFFLQIAAQRQLTVNQYVDQAIGVMKKNEIGKMSITQVTLRPKVTFGDVAQPTACELEDMHHQAHEQCFIANSVKTRVCTEIITE